MKFLLILIIGWLPLCAMSQDSTIAFSEIVAVNGVSKTDLVSRARQWLPEHLKSVKEQLPDSQLVVITGKGVFKTVIPGSNMLDSKDTYEIWFMGTIWIKDGRYKYQFTNYEIQKDGLTTDYGILTSAVNPPNIKGLMGKGSRRATWQGCRKDVEKQSEEFINSLKTAMSRASASEF